MVEYNVMDISTMTSDTKTYPNLDIETLKVNSDNIINIKPIKTNWSREEVETLIRQWASFTVTGRGQWWKPNDLDNWIKQNL